ncbi:MAG: hypothetical protein AB1815_02740 [Bacillota bacterium]
MKLTDEAIRVALRGRRRWRWYRCRPLQVLMLIVGAAALAIPWLPFVSAALNYD